MTSKIISSFTGPYRWLSNFYCNPTSSKTIESFGVERLYQAHKTLDANEKMCIISAKSPGKAKKIGRTVTVREDWEDVKVEIMLKLLRLKFKHYRLKQWLLNTGDAILIEGNSWHDTFWGIDNKTCRGDNVLGVLLMLVREELKQDERDYS
jgi:ribA/ribD-fused uncharacterized protein